MWVVLLLAGLASPGLAAENLMLTGKPASWETWGETPRQRSLNSDEGEALETPNQARRRLGLPIAESFPAQDPSISEETPNHRRQRLSLESTATSQELLAQAR